MPFSICVAIAGLWWLGFAALTTFRFVQPRPGPPLPAGESYLLYPFKRMFRTAKAAGTMPETLKFLLAWFMFSDGFNTICGSLPSRRGGARARPRRPRASRAHPLRQPAHGVLPLRGPALSRAASVGAIYANTSVTYDGIGKGIGITLLLLLVPLFAGVGGIFWNWVHATGRLTAKQIIVVNCVLMTLTPAYGLLGFADGRLGYRRWWELYLGVIFYGLNLGSVQSFSRSTFGSMIPEGMEANMYALYNVTDRGSSWIGPGVVAAILSATGNIRYAFLYPIGMLLVPMALLYFVDVQRGVRMAANYAVANKTAAVAGSRGAVSVLAASAAPAEAESAELLPAKGAAAS